MRELVKNFWKDEEGATAVEYGVLVALIIAVAIAAVVILGGKVNNAFTGVNDAMTVRSVRNSGHHVMVRQPLAA
ncbi:MAG: Flp family type IVb pilin [Desulfuromonadales bacterium]|nr:Flp family type IVb pilin [Desulfuromonadales bacterium]MDW7758870.1 Flp family type IVb pilin [Desulfuromonadales bacterium]